MSTLLYSMGEEADDVLSSTNITEEERRVYATVMGKFEGFFKVRKNVIFERARFNRRNQLDGETSEKYITELYRQIDSCEYGDMKEELLRDRLVVGILDHELSEKLQLEADLTLEAAKKSIRQKGNSTRCCKLMWLQNLLWMKSANLVGSGNHKTNRVGYE